MRSNTDCSSAVIVFGAFWPSCISVICLEKLRDLSLGPMTLFQRPSVVTSNPANDKAQDGVVLPL